jgi:hypothetical protein
MQPISANNGMGGSTGAGGNPFPQASWNNPTTPNTGSPGGVPQFVPPAANGNGLPPINPRNNSSLPGWNTPANNAPSTNGAGFNPPNGNGNGNFSGQGITPPFQQPSSQQPSGYVPPNNQPTTERYPSNPANPNEFDTARRDLYNNGNWQTSNTTNSGLPPLVQSRNPQYGMSVPAPAGQADPQAQYYESLLGQMQQKIDTLTRQNIAANQRADSLVPGHQLPVTNAWSADPYGYGTGQRSLLASVRGAETELNRLPPASIPGSANESPSVSQLRESATATASLEDANRRNAFLFFWLMCSIGLNIYLGWISRGFYVRYRELAEELRETFSTV